jgi:pyruvate kinase
VKQCPDFGVDERQILARAVRGHLREHGIDEVIQSREVAFDGVRNDLAHNEKANCMRYTKIVATIGPASSSDEMLDAMIKAGVNVVRLNFSHGTPESHAASVKRIRSAAIEPDATWPSCRIFRDRRSGPGPEGAKPIPLTPAIG